MTAADISKFTVVGTRENGQPILAHAIADSVAQLFGVATAALDGAHWFLLHGHVKSTGVPAASDFGLLVEQAFRRDASNELKDYLAWIRNTTK